MKAIINHQREIAGVAAVSDCDFLSVLPRVASPLVQAEISHLTWTDQEKVQT